MNNESSATLTHRPNKLLKLEAIRGLAAIYVVLHHTINFKYYVLGVNIGEILRFGQEAVILFFLVSGFVINYSFHYSKDKSFKTYFFKRFLRIYIPLCIVFVMGFITDSYNNGSWVDVPLKDVVMNLLMLQDWPADKPGVIVKPLFENYPLWSLMFEWWFYMLYYPVARLIVCRYNQCSLMFIIAMISSVIYLFYPTFLPRLLTYSCIWWVGVYLSNLYIDGKLLDWKKYIFPVSALTLILIVAVLKTAFWKQGGGEIHLGLYPLIEVRHVAFALIALAIAVCWHTYQWRFFSAFVGPFTILAPISYVIYISHTHLMTNATWLEGLQRPVLEWFLYLVGLLIFSWIVECVIYPKLRNIIVAKIA